MKELEARFQSSRYYLSKYYTGLSILNRDYSNRYYTAMFYKSEAGIQQQYTVPALKVQLVHAYDVDAEPTFKNNTLIANSIYEGKLNLPEFTVRVKVLGKLIRVYIVE